MLSAVCNTAEVAALSFSYSSFDQCSDSIKLYGEASCMNSGIQLTSFGYYVIGQARYFKPMHLWDATTGGVASFTTTFTFDISSNVDSNNSGSSSEDGSSSCCDGLAFFLAPRNYSIPVGGGASGRLGLIYANLTYDSASENPFVAVEFDTYNNEWDAWNDSSHVGININSLQSVSSKRWNYNGNGTRRMRARISYNKDAKTMCASWFSSRDDNDQFEFENTLCYGVDLTNYLPEQQYGSVCIGVSVGSRMRIKVCWLTANWINAGAKYIPPDVVSQATNGFIEVLGRGGFGEVYKGKLDGRAVAVKKLFQVVAAGGGRGNKEGYMAELTVITQLKHHNLVELLRWSCGNSGELYLVYDYMENGSLDSHLFSQEPGHQPLIWEIRFRIAKDLGSGLLYLHGGCTECVLHRDIKPANVLLDSDMRAKLSDFGLARVVGHDDRSQSLIYGSEGYLAPEVLETGKSTKSSDVFSFGVVALQIVSGKSAYVINNSAQRRHIVEWAWGLYGEGHVEAVVDPKLNGVFVEEQVRRLLEVGLHCAHPDPSRRPRMKDAMDALNFSDPLGLAPLPLQYPTNRSSQAGLLPSLSRILEESPAVSSLQQQLPVLSSSLSSSGVVPPAHDQIDSFDQPVSSVNRAQGAVSRLYRTV
ncbi:unnamed protein product [Linum trigynum]|uniref:non-specific serine/threonine protein kinase n=1 Tax=Linum trigynum TaxID=586398 RepID=A0AAV2GDY4_9ROSI